MPSNSEVRVTPYGIPYVVEFANVSIWPRPPIVHAHVGYHTSNLVPKPSLSRSNTLPATSTHKPLPTLPLPVRSKSLKLFKSKAPAAHKATRSRLYRLSRAISKAVLAAGMEAPPKPTKKFDAEVSAGANNEDARLVKGSQGLFKGTYGQVRAAFRAAGLVTTPCGEDGVPDATRLGALFIANPDGRGAIVFTKVVMWG
ncbi:hypothetical protein EDB85DRAFT_2079767 [Lactarius pseudohatsudake]|nr:hypothetical protein EDB85DRAFT_2079767 [Lactarius pseudohatsudake]